MLETGEAADRALAGQPPELDRGAGAHAIRLPLDAPESPAELHHHAAHPAIADEDVGATAQERHAHARRARLAQDDAELVDGVGTHQEVGWTTDPVRGVPRQRLVRPHALAEHMDEARVEVGESHGQWIWGIAAPERSSARSSSAVR